MKYSLIIEISCDNSGIKLTTVEQLNKVNKIRHLSPRIVVMEIHKRTGVHVLTFLRVDKRLGKTPAVIDVIATTTPLKMSSSLIASFTLNLNAQ